MGKHLNDKISAIYRISCISLDKKFESLSLTRAQAAFLISVCEKEGQSQEQVAAWTQMDKGAAARVFKQLEEGGYIKRLSCMYDKRKHCIFPRRKAKELYPELKAVMNEWDRTLTNGLTDLEISMLDNLLNRVNENIR
ncbi:MAG: winged helix-turn-helix transcriptional regulator [Lachnospiraceae bacterium]|nr:winged helix-turn-helix transcriptional regulator [Lachnospiraceae bacterium]